ncbi:MAG: type I methionyl aminopeptidase [Thermotogaceae bacterium]|nr:type I methionyl aminopeptidase [Thermotogota bacterium]NLZ13344.1 type I methionyl aminopeptidase [Thermotogaceae bacterium]MDD8040195.1 type I methionyl aminopeptidase [Thermotogota bacterium]MDD8052792.1 type I methionyl aminopeptidase [Thermotogota bacterium]HNR63971.1 type I methionyl aminopeptidase [Thermotogota bacterium]
MIILKRPEEIEKMAMAGEIVGRAIQLAGERLKPGLNTREIDKWIEDYIRLKEAIPSFKGYHGFPYASCISINEEIVHGMPAKNRRIKEGDIVSIDVGAFKNGYHADSARTFAIGTVSAEAKKLMEITFQALDKAIEKVAPKNPLGTVSHAIQEWVEKHGFSVIRDYVGHGIGKNLHEDPQIPNYGEPSYGVILRKGMVLAIEPMVSAGDWRTDLLKNGWTAVTLDRSLSAHYEDTVALCDSGVRNLTRV